MSLFHKTARILRGGDEKTVTAAVILAAGNSTRMGKNKNKQLMTVNGIPVLAHTLMAYQKCDHINHIVVVARETDFDSILAMRKKYKITKLIKLVCGGKTRQESAQIGVANVAPDTKYVAIADGARCLVTPEQIESVCRAAYKYKAATAAHRATDTIKIADKKGFIDSTVDRETVWHAQTPQVFKTKLYRAAAYTALKNGVEATDDNSLVENIRHPIRLVECGTQNIKVTTIDDLIIAEAIIKQRELEASLEDI